MISGRSAEKLMQSGEASDTWHPLIRGREKMGSDVELYWGTRVNPQATRRTRSGENGALTSTDTDGRERRAGLEKKRGGAYSNAARWLGFDLAGRLLRQLICLGFEPKFCLFV
ncbi:hypothetical protein TIFTF001_053675 [Ficus carica]|uniref:Uncharacterized protein n=1 Tax=Ficus carica TaxID=3494 RepID=A0AA88EEG5_FICCA|nr:hypothetical protein TIFTF001_053675 [Ficus carica]